MHVTLVPVLGAVGEEKTKPSQHTVQQVVGGGAGVGIADPTLAVT